LKFRVPAPERVASRDSYKLGPARAWQLSGPQFASKLGPENDKVY